MHDAGYLNKDFASAKLTTACAMLAKGEGAHYPILTALVSQLVADLPRTRPTTSACSRIPATTRPRTG